MPTIGERLDMVKINKSLDNINKTLNQMLDKLDILIKYVSRDLPKTDAK